MKNHITNEDAINTLIAGPLINTNQISDGYHTFGELYNHRITLFITLCKYIHFACIRNPDEISPVWKSKLHSDGSAMEGWFVMGIFVESGKQITYHLPMTEWDITKFAQERELAPAWDGHTSDDVLNRLSVLL